MIIYQIITTNHFLKKDETNYDKRKYHKAIVIT